MSRTIETQVFQFNELSDRAKERARDWFRSGNQDYDWYELIYSDVDTIAKILGIEIDRKPVKLMGGGTRYEPMIWFSGFSSQGDGACFEGRYRYAKGCSKAIRKYAPKDAALHDIADRLVALQRRHAYSLNARMEHRGHYYHSGCMSVDVASDRDDWTRERDVSGEDCDALVQIMRDFADWIYALLRAEDEYMNADEQVDESILSNGYEFTEDGERA